MSRSDVFSGFRAVRPDALLRGRVLAAAAESTEDAEEASVGTTFAHFSAFDLAWLACAALLVIAHAWLSLGPRQQVLRAETVPTPTYRSAHIEEIDGIALRGDSDADTREQHEQVLELLRQI
jgi:hypothetical protein